MNEHAQSASVQSNKKGGGKVPPTAATLLPGYKPQCCYCNRNHAPERCDQVSYQDERKQALRYGVWVFAEGTHWPSVIPSYVGREALLLRLITITISWSNII